MGPNTRNQTAATKGRLKQRKKLIPSLLSMWNSSPTLLPAGSAVFTEMGVLVGQRGATGAQKGLRDKAYDLQRSRKPVKSTEKFQDPQFFSSQHCWGEEKYDAFCYTQVLALSAHPVLNNKGQSWKLSFYEVYLLRTAGKKSKNLFLF